MRFTLVATALLMAPAAHAANSSVYTRLVYEGVSPTCKSVEADETDGGSSLSQCRGYKTWTVYVAEGDLRDFVSYGSKDELAAGETFAPFNTVGDTVEWRLRDGAPIATILRWKIDGGGGQPKGEMLVVTQLKPGQQCWIAAVSATKNPKANELARQAADSLAGTVTCKGSTIKILGTPDSSIEFPDLSQ